MEDDYKVVMVPGPCATPAKKFVKIRSQLMYSVIQRTDRQTERTKNITSFGGGNMIRN